MQRQKSISQFIDVLHSFTAFQKIGDILGFTHKRCKNCGNPYFVTSEHYFYPSLELCLSCLKQIIPVREKLCGKCGNFLQHSFNLEDKQKACCQTCRKNPPAWDNIAFYGLYKEELRDLLLSFKFGSQNFLAPLFADFLLEVSACLSRPDILVAVPMHRDRLIKRGFNQAHEICKALARKSGFPFSSSLIAKIKRTHPQEKLDAYERSVNQKDSFKASRKAAQYNHIWLIDDIMTTGSTLQECSLQLKKSGVNKVSVLFVARTPLD